MKRLRSLDIIRGMTVAGMILVNNGYGDSFTPLRHARWNGLSLSDFVFPFFLFIMGVSIYLSFSSRGFGFTRERIGKVVKRSVLLLSIGIAINWFDMAIWGEGMQFGELRFWAVLQRIAVCYLLVSLFALSCNHRHTLTLACSLLLIYALILISGHGYSEDKSENLLYLVDAYLFGDAHLYHKSAVDPEGLLSTISSLSNVLFGFYCGMQMKHRERTDDKLIALFTTGTVLAGIGFCMNFGLPCNKHIWSPSFALVTSGACALLLALVMRFSDGGASSAERCPGIVARFFIAFGSNALLLYITSELMAIIFGRIGLSAMLYGVISAICPIPQVSSLCYSISFVMMNYLIAAPLYTRRIFVKL